MRFFHHCLFLLLSVPPGVAGAQTLPEPASGLDPVAPTRPPEPAPDLGGGCALGYCGYIKAGETPLAGASVFVKGTSCMVVSNALGFFVLPTTITRWPTLLISAAGYESAESSPRSCEPLAVELRVLASTKFKKHGRKKGWIVPPKRHR